MLVRGWQSVSPFSLVLKAFFPIPGLVCQDKSASDCVMGQHAVCELKSSRCRPRVISALLRVYGFSLQQSKTDLGAQNTEWPALICSPGTRSF